MIAAASATADTAIAVVAGVGLVVLLVTAYRAPAARVELVISLVVGAVVLGLAVPGRVLDAGTLRAALERLGPVVVFLMAILVVAEVCARAGLFDAGARAVVRFAGPRPWRLLVGVFVLAAAVTVVFSLDATAVLLTPVVLGAATRAGVSSRPGIYACLRMANSASLLLPVSNLTNLLALPDLDLGFVGFAARMAPVLVVVLVLELVALRLGFGPDLVAAPDSIGRSEPVRASGPAAGPGPVPALPGAVVAAMLVGFVAGSPLGVDPAWVAGVAALVLAGWAWRTGLIDGSAVLGAAHPSFAVFVLSLGVVVAVLSRAFLGDLVAPLLPGSTAAAASFLGLLTVAVVATVAANLLTNLAATLLVVPLVAPLGDIVVLAALLGLNIGSGLTYAGSLANLLWRRGLADRGVGISMWDFHRYSLPVTPVVLLGAVGTLWLTTH